MVDLAEVVSGEEADLEEAEHRVDGDKTVSGFEFVVSGLLEELETTNHKL